MESIRIRVSHVMDFGSVVTIAGVDERSNAPVMVHVDHRPTQQIEDGWKAARLPEPVAFEAEQLVLTLDIAIDGEDSGERSLPPAA